MQGLNSGGKLLYPNSAETKKGVSVCSCPLTITFWVQKRGKVWKSGLFQVLSQICFCTLQVHPRKRIIVHQSVIRRSQKILYILCCILLRIVSTENTGQRIYRLKEDRDCVTDFKLFWTSPKVPAWAISLLINLQSKNALQMGVAKIREIAPDGGFLLFARKSVNVL